MALDLTNETVQAWVAVLGLFFTLVPLAWAAYQYVAIKRAEERQRRFETYHGLIKSLVDGEDGRDLRLDRQLAIVFELRNFPEYFEPSLRILNGLRKTWPQSRLTSQMESTSSYIRIRLREKNFLWPDA